MWATITSRCSRGRRLQFAAAVSGSKRHGSKFGLEPACRPGCGFGLVPPAPSGAVRGIEGTVSHHAKEPGRGVSGESALRSKLDERLLNHVLRRIAPLPREQLEGRRVLIHKSPQPVGIHAKVAFGSARLPP